MNASCSSLEDELRQCSKEERVTMADSVETLGVDLRTMVKRLGVDEKAIRKMCKVRFSLIKKNKAIRKNYIKVGVKKLLRAGMVPARTWRVHAVETALEKLKLRRQMAAAAGKSSTISLSLFMDVIGLEVEQALSTLAAQYWAEGVWIGKWHHEQKEVWMNQICEVQMWRQVRGPAGEVMCESRDLGIEWPQWHTLVLEGDGRIDMRYVPERCEEDAVAAGHVSLLEEVGNKARVSRVEGGYLAGTGSGFATQENEGRLD